VDWSQLTQPQFWIATLQIILINILLSGDNAVVIALACRNLPRRDRRFGMVIGAGLASALRILFTALVAFLMRLPYLQLVGGCLLLWIAAKLLIPQEEHAEGSREAAEDLWRAVRIVVIADIVMSLDNVVAVAAAAEGSYMLLAVGLCVSIVLVIAGAALITALLDRFPILIWAGAALLGWIAGGLLASDTAVAPYLSAPTTLNIDIDSTMFGPVRHYRLVAEFDLAQLGCRILGALGVLLAGGLLRRARVAATAERRTLVHEPRPMRDRA
jgi:YjbE family integral membrane protein